MNDPREVVLAKQLRMFVALAAIGATLVGVLVLAGWAFDLPALLTWGMQTIMAPAAGACLVLAGIALWLLRKEHPPRQHAGIARAAAALVGVTGALTLTEHIFSVDLGIDRLFLARSRVFDIADARIRMSPVASVVFVLLGLALFSIDWRTSRHNWPAQYLALAAAMGVALGMLGLILHANNSDLEISLPSIVAESLLIFGVVVARAPWAMSGLLVSNTRAARWLRRTVPPALLILGIIGWLIAKPLLAGGLYTWMEVTALAALYGVILASFLTCIAFIVDPGESRRRRAVLAPIAGDEPRQKFNQIEEPQNEVELRHRVTVGFALAIVLTCLLSFLSWRMGNQAINDAAQVAQAHAVCDTLQDTLQQLDDAEAAAQAFALTGGQPFLQPYQAAENAVAGDLLRLHSLIFDPSQTKRLQTLEIQADTRMHAIANAVTTRKDSGASRVKPRLQPGVDPTHAVRVTVAEMQVIEERLLLQRSRRAQIERRFNLCFLALGALAGTVFLVLAGATVSREVAASGRARTQVIALISDLKQRAHALEAEIAARLQTDTRLRESEGRLGDILQSAMDAIVTIDEEQRIVLFNRAAESLFACPASQAMGQPITRFIPHHVHPLQSAHIAEAAEAGLTNCPVGQPGLLWVVRADGEDFQIEASISETVVGGKRLTTVIARDVSERARADAVCEHLAAVVSSSDDAIITKDLRGRITGWNRGAEKIFGYPAAEVIGHPMLILFPSDRAHEESDILAHTARGESVEHFETVMVRKDSRRIDVSLTISPLRDGNGTIVGASKIARDVTEHKQFEEKLICSQQALEAEQRMLQSVLDSMVEGLVAADEQGQIIICNPAAARILSPHAGNLPQDHFRVYQPDTVTLSPADQHPMARAIRGEVSTTEIFVRPPGSENGVWLEAHGAPLRDKSGPGRGGVVAFRDITQKRAAEFEIRKLNENLEERIAQRTRQLEAANHELEAFTYSVSHDLRAPLRHVTGFATALLEEFGKTLDPQALRYLERIQDGTRRMRTLIDELLNLAKTGQKPLRLEPTSLHAVVEQIINLLEGETEGREVEWRIGELPILQCDPVLVRQIFQNLLSNAIKYSRPRAHAIIEVGQSRKKDVTVIYVRDNGVGFDMKHASHLFGVFQRLHRDEDFEGTGIGLATVERIVKKHGGEIWAEAEIDRGATFYFTLGGPANAILRIKGVPTTVGS